MTINHNLTTNDWIRRERGRGKRNWEAGWRGKIQRRRGGGYFRLFGLLELAQLEIIKLV